MKIKASDYVVAYLTLLSGLSISAVAVYYSVIGLTSIFAAAALPVIIMGVCLELSKLVATVWLKQNWKYAPITIKFYLFSAIIILMLITSMGIFGFLSKAHLDQNLQSGDVVDKVAFIDEKIKIQRDNIESARSALKQMDMAVDQLMARTTDDIGARRSANLRRTQQRERVQLQQDITNAQRQISLLNEERIPAAKNLRQVEAEVGPIKYIAAFFYGSTDKNILEKSVTWVIIILIVVFDPLAVILLIASQISFQKIRDYKSQILPVNPVENIVPIQDTTPVEIQKSSPVESSEQKIEEIPIATLEESEAILEKTEPEIIETPSVETVTKSPIDWSLVTPDQEYVVVDGQKMSIKAAMSLYPPTQKIPRGYVQNEEQSESNLWQNLNRSLNDTKNNTNNTP